MRKRHNLDTTGAIPVAEIKARLDGRPRRAVPPPSPPYDLRLGPYLIGIGFLIAMALLALAYINADVVSDLVNGWVSW